MTLHQTQPKPCENQTKPLSVDGDDAEDCTAAVARSIPPSLQEDHIKDINGSVIAQGNPVLGVHIFLYSKDVSEIKCLQGSAHGPRQEAAMCHAVTDADEKVTGFSVGGGVVDGNTPQSVLGKNHLESSISNNHYDEPRGANSYHTSQREATLLKFRLKRKDRCYDKKVRYESRKRQADKRRQMEGQFVRQLQSELAVLTGGLVKSV
ncbi:hypothetical protein KIW84_045414 [Lathyrus oleraceus]|uniref:CCT domain-containing protein n=1 Tax=Pisum sativum TaxID=3888 RepID=A0A9D4XNS0_PEA|nr:hypothetical protein KIW84_045414 [Pisum sativum]